jgi:hypothetical protein
MAFNIPQQNIDDATDAAISWHARQFNQTLPPDPAVGDSQPFNERPGALTARQWAIAKQSEFIAWTVAEYKLEQERKRLKALRQAPGFTVAQVDLLIGTEPA